MFVLAGVQGLGQFQTQRHAGGLRHPVGQPRSQRPGGRKVRRVRRKILPAAAIGVVMLTVGVRTETAHRPSWTRRRAWRPQRSRESTARQPRSFRASTCSTPGRCHTTTPCCPLPPWRTTVPVRKTLFFSCCVNASYLSCCK